MLAVGQHAQAHAVARILRFHKIVVQLRHILSVGDAAIAAPGNAPLNLNERSGGSQINQIARCVGRMSFLFHIAGLRQGGAD